MKKVVRPMQAASTLSEGNSLPNLFHVLIIFTKWIWFANSFMCFSDRHIWPPGQRTEILWRIALDHYRKSVQNSMKLPDMCG